MPSQFDEYLKKGNFSQEDVKATQVEKAEHTQRNSGPNPTVTDPRKADATPGTLDDRMKEGIESTQKDGKDAYDQQKPSMSDRYPSSQSKGQEPAPQQQDKDRDNER